MKTFLLFMFYAGFFGFQFARDRLQSFSCLLKQLSATDAQKSCTDSNESLITIFDRDDVTSVSCCKECHTGFWIGLGRKTRTRSTWSDGTEVTFNESSVIADEYTQTCEALDNGTWTGFNCSEMKFFMCNTRDGYKVIESEKNWCQALHFCNKNGGSLARINSSEENERAKNISKGLTVWIGLMHDQWEWPNQKCSSYRDWDEYRQDGDCVFSMSNTLLLNTLHCKNQKPAICSRGKVRIKVIQKESSWDEARSHCEKMHSRLLWIEDESDQNAVRTWLNHWRFAEDAPRSLWIGLRQSALFGFWIWTDRMVSWSNWKDEVIPGKSPSNHCGVIDRKDFTWRNEDCDSKLPFLCEEDIAYSKN